MPLEIIAAKALEALEKVKELAEATDAGKVTDAVKDLAQSPAVQERLDLPLEKFMTRETQVQEMTDLLKNVEGLKPQNWEKLNFQERVEVLREVEAKQAALEGRVPTRIETEKMPEGALGRHVADTNTLYINEALVRDRSPVLATNTVLHEGRHATQDHAVKSGVSVRHGADVVSEWKQNFERYISPMENFRRYWRQPIEVDARAYAGSICEKLYGVRGV